MPLYVRGTNLLSSEPGAIASNVLLPSWESSVTINVSDLPGVPALRQSAVAYWWPSMTATFVLPHIDSKSSLTSPRKEKSTKPAKAKRSVNLTITDKTLSTIISLNVIFQK